MTTGFDTLSFTKALENAGVTRDIAEGHATAIRDHVMKEFVTKQDLEAALDRLIIRIGVMLAAGLGMLFAALRLFH